MRLALIALLLSGCETLPERPSSRTNPPLASKAQTLYQQGRFAESARAFSAMAQNSDEGSGQNWLRAADAFWMAREPLAARRAIGRVDQAKLARDERSLASILLAASASPQLPAPALLRQLGFSANTVPTNYRALFHHLRAQALGSRKLAYQSALELVAMGQYLNPAQRGDNHQSILATLQRLPVDQANALLARHPRNDEMHGWLKLIAMTKQSLLDGFPVQDAVAEWKLEFPGHPGALQGADQLAGSFSLAFGKPSNIALLLPMSGRFAEAGRAVRDGFLSAFFSDPERAAGIRVYDVGETPERAALQYDLAVRDGAEQIIGPLSKEAVTEMLLKADGNVPVLTLNQSREDVPAARGVFQFGLLPEHEAASVARRMIADGKMRSIVMVPESNWGDRLADAFTRSYRSDGGEVLNIGRYPSRGADYGPVIKNALGLTASSSRVRELERLLGYKLKSEAGARHDLDAIFLAARPNQGRLIKPQFEFHNAADVPVYSTSTIYGGKPDPNMDKDMNGVRFCDEPWLVGAPSEAPNAAMARTNFAAGGTPLRLFGLGLDAYRLLPYLSWLMESPTDVFPGATGQLSVDPSGKVHRELACAEIRRGLANYLEPVLPQTEFSEFPGLTSPNSEPSTKLGN